METSRRRMENLAPTLQHPHIATLRSNDVPIFINPMSRRRRDLISKILRYKVEVTSLKGGREGTRRKDDGDVNRENVSTPVFVFLFSNT